MKNIICLYHADCVDGFVSKTLIELLHKNDTAVSIPVRYNEPIENITSRIPNVFDVDKIIIVDFSLPFSEIKILLQYCRNILIIDHHNTAINLYEHEEKIDIFNLNNSCNLIVFLESGISTSSIIYNSSPTTLMCRLGYKNNTFEEKNRNIKAFIDRINDYDIWNLEYDNTFIVNETVRCIFESELSEDKKRKLTITMMEMFEKICLYISSKINNNIPDELINFIISAEKIVNDRNIIVNHYVKSLSVKSIHDINVPFIQCPSNIANYVGNALTYKYPYVFIYWINVIKNTVKISLRSDKYNGVNVREIAEQHGGGGHNNSAGIEMNYDNFMLFIKLYVR